MTAIPIITVITFDDKVQNLPSPEKERERLKADAIKVTGDLEKNVFFVANLVAGQEDVSPVYEKRVLQMVEQALKSGEQSIKMRQNQRESAKIMALYFRTEYKDEEEEKEEEDEEEEEEDEGKHLKYPFSVPVTVRCLVLTVYVSFTFYFQSRAFLRLEMFWLADQNKQQTIYPIMSIKLEDSNGDNCLKTKIRKPINSTLGL